MAEIVIVFPGRIESVNYSQYPNTERRGVRGERMGFVSVGFAVSSAERCVAEIVKVFPYVAGLANPGNHAD